MLRTSQFRALHSVQPQGAQHRCISHAAFNGKRNTHVAAYQEVFNSRCWEVQRSWLSKAVAGAVSLSLLLQAAPASSEEMSIAFPASADPEIRQAQQTMVESWAYVQALYFDPSFSHTDWAQELQDSLAASFKASSAAEVTDLTNQLLAKLGDPYTRLLQGDDATALEAQEEGKIVATGLGLQQVLLLPQGSPAATADAAIAHALATASADTAALELSSSSSSVVADAAAAAAPTGQEALLVSFVVGDSAAAAAGVKEGDLLLSVDGQPVAGKELRQIYKLLSKEADVTLLQPQPGSNNSSSSSGVSGSIQLTTQLTNSNPGSSNTNSSSSSSEAVRAAAVAVGYSPDAYTVHLKPTPLEFAPVQFGTINIDKAVAGAAAAIEDSSGATITTTISSSSSDSSASHTGSSSSSSIAGLPDVGYLKLLSFSATAPQVVAQALVDMQYEAAEEHGGHGLAGIIVDLRDNPGGIVEAGVSIARDFLQEGQVLCIALDKSGQEERVVLPTAHTLTQLPLVVLVNRSTASTSELLAGALHDELSAPLIGTKTYGKGRSQRVVQLADGTSTLLVSTLKYFTPQHTEIDQAGLRPDLVCDPLEVVGGKWTGGRVDGEDQGGLSLLDDPCVKLAAEKLAGRAL